MRLSRRYGMQKMEPRIADKIAFEPMSGSWLWIGATTSCGYGSLWVDGRSVRAHRYLYEQHCGPVPKSLVLDHLCELRRCVNWDHIAPVSNRHNILRGVGPTARNAHKTHCNSGHPLDGENLYVRPSDSARMCRACTTRNHGKYLKHFTAQDRSERSRRAAQTRWSKSLYDAEHPESI